jgi:riboflavin transporter FmnP
MKQNSTRIITLLGVMTALAYILYFLELPVGFIFPAAPFLKIDFSDIPAIMVGLSAGPLAGVVVELFKNILHAIFLMKEPAGSGEIANFTAGIAYLIPVALIARKDFRAKKYIPAMIIGTLCTVVAMSFINYFVTLPLYGITDNTIKLSMIYTTFAPFNLIKGAVLSVVIVLLYPRLKSVLRKFS